MLQPSWPSSCRLTVTPTCIVGQTNSGPLAGHGFVSSKLADELGVAVTPAISTARMVMSGNRFTVVARRHLRVAGRTAFLRNRDANPSKSAERAVLGETRERLPRLGTQSSR